MKSLKKKLSIYILSRFALSLIIFTASLGLCFLLAIVIGGRMLRGGQGVIYDLLHFAYDHAYGVYATGWVIGFILLFSFFWIKTLGYLENIIKAMEIVYRREGSDLIVLPDELSEVQNQMNQIRLDIRETERIAKEAEQRKNDLIVYLAHDLKTPLTSVVGYLTLLLEEREISKGLQEKYLGTALGKAERLAELIDEFFEIARFNLTALTLEKSKVNLTRMLEQITYEFRPALVERNLDIELEAPEDLMISCDADKMQRVFDNIMRNAVHYSFLGSKIDITVKGEGEGVWLSFQNHGAEIPKDKLDRLFEQFYRLDVARASGTGGAGLGLAIAKEIVELHGGKIQATSEGEMIQIQIYLPHTL